MKRGASLGITDACTSILEMSMLGVKSIMFAGEGEPLIHNGFLQMARYAKQQDIDIALTTNGSLLTSEISYELLPIMSWIKVSLCSASLSTFSKMSGFDRVSGAMKLGHVILNIYEAVEIRNKLKHKCDIGVQMLVTEENVRDIAFTIKAIKELGVDYIVLKQYSHHPSSINQHTTPIIDSFYEQMGSDKFKVIIRRPIVGHNYDKCYALPFWSYIASSGNVYACSSHIPDSRFLMGNIYKDKLIDIWDRNRYKKLQEEIDVTKCRVGCRMNKCNEYLSELVNPNSHVNFI
jgi:radical SAM protein with 4Fe4S-binding SPASM domain